MMVNALISLGKAYVGNKSGGNQRDNLLAITQQTENAKKRAMERGKVQFQTTQFKAPQSRNIPMERFLGLWERSLQYANNLTEQTVRQMKQENKTQSQIQSIEKYFNRLSDTDATAKAPTLKLGA